MGISRRLDICDTRSLNCTSFSEAPAESIFSSWDRFQTGRESLKHDNIVAMIRVAREGPPAASKAAFKISDRALELWPSKRGESLSLRGSQHTNGLLGRLHEELIRYRISNNL